MAIKYQGSGKFTYNLDVQAQKPLDSRLVVASYENDLAGEKYKLTFVLGGANAWYDGMLVYAEDTKRVYVLQGDPADGGKGFVEVGSDLIADAELSDTTYTFASATVAGKGTDEEGNEIDIEVPVESGAYFTVTEEGGTPQTVYVNADIAGAAAAALVAAKEYADGLPHANTTYTFAEGTVNGEFVVTPSDGTAQQVKVHGLGDAAYTTVAALESTMDSKDQAIAAAAATDAQGKADKALADAKAWVKEQKYVTASIIDGLATEEYVNNAVKDEADTARAAEEALGKRIDDLAAAAVSVKEGTINHVKVTKNGTEYTVEGVDIASQSVVDTLIGDDKAMSARAIVQDEVAKQLTSENISDSFDTLKEMAEWLSSHPEDVKEMNDAIGANKTAIEAEVLRATTAEGNLQTAIDNEVSARKAAIAALNATVGSQNVAEGKHVAVEVVETDGKLTGLTVVESNIASAKDLSDLVKVVNDNEHVTAAALNELNGRMVTAEGSVADHETRLTTAEGEIDALQAAVGGLDLGVKTVKGQGGEYVTVTPAEASKGDVTVSVSVATTKATNTAYTNDALATDGYVEEQAAAAESNAKTYADNLMSWVEF